MIEPGGVLAAGIPECARGAGAGVHQLTSDLKDVGDIGMRAARGDPGATLVDLADADAFSECAFGGTLPPLGRRCPVRARRSMDLDHDWFLLPVLGAAGPTRQLP